ncbi:hypothetical protein QEN58_03735 [Halomonas alkaliantarctica]|uniref:Tn3 transposase DDE domain-containing protein n=1 Tax=Halomonas alkaliantarctica TaxID=232346 RepID=A0ABY8LSL3_9GAMM|nr:hypothetical protein [Halomonas alkaliantarctica]WGI27404.1 hypothetical protein QEN58_03735 [Halomonas alkaliantarctica]
MGMENIREHGKGDQKSFERFHKGRTFDNFSALHYLDVLTTVDMYLCTIDVGSLA